MPDYGDPSPEFVERVRVACAGLPEAYEEPAWVGTRWRIRKRTIVHLFTMDTERESVTAVMFRATGPELEVLRACGPPYFSAPEWNDAAGMVLDEDTDWAEVRELLTESYCLMAPKKLAALIDRPELAE